MPFCAFCDAELPADFRVVRATLCPHCDAYLHACVQCRFHEPTLHNQCLEPEADYVGNREKANFCDFFQLAGAREGGHAEVAQGKTAKPGNDDRAREARAKLEALFKKKPGSD